MSVANNVVASVLGGQPKGPLSVYTVEDAKKALNLQGTYTASVNGEPADLDEHLQDGDYVAFAPAVKGGR